MADVFMEDLGGNFADETNDVENAMSASTELRKRRSTRIVQAVPLAVTGVDALGRPFTERTSTLIINCHGCRYQSKHYVLKNMWVTLEIPHPEAGQAARSVRGRVAWIQRPRTVRQLFQVALELEQPGNAWGMAFPPEDWFGFPENAAHSAGPGLHGVTISGMPGTTHATDAGHVEHLSGAGGEAGTGDAADAPMLPGADNVRIFPSPVSTTDASLQLARQMARLLTDAKQQIQATARDAATNAVSTERHIAFEQWEQKFAAARVEVVNEAQRAIEKLQMEAEALGKRIAASVEELTEKTRRDLPETLTPQLHEVAQQTARTVAENTAQGVSEALAAQLAERAATQKSQFDEHTAATAETLRDLCAKADAAASQLATQREAAASEMEQRSAAITGLLAEARRKLEVRAQLVEAGERTIAENLQLIEGQSRALHESREAAEEDGRRRAAALTAQGEALQAAVRDSEARLAELHAAETKAHDAVESVTQDAVERASSRLAVLQDESIARHAATQVTLEASLREQLARELETAKSAWREHVAETLQAAMAGELAGAVATARENAKRGLEEHVQGLRAQLAEESARNVAQQLDERLQGHVYTQLDEQLAAHIQRQLGERIESHSAALHEMAARMASELEQRVAAQCNAAVHAAGQAAEQAEQRLTAARDTTAHTANELEQRAASLRSSMEEFVAGTFREKTEALVALLAEANEAGARLEQFSGRLDAAREDSLHGFRAQLDDVLTLHRNELHRRSESLFDEINGRVRAAFEEASRAAVTEVERKIGEVVQPHVTQAEEAVHRLAGGRSLLDAAMTLQQDRIRGFADEAFAESLGRFRENLGSVEQVLQQASQAITERSLAELEGKVEGLKHQAVEDVFKSAEWYEKKAQTHIQTATDRAVEQAANLLREKAGEVSGTFASEVDHASRNFIGHTTTQMEEVLRDAFERSRGLFAETAETTQAAFTDEIQRTALRELAGFSEELQRTAGEMRGQVENARIELAVRLTADQEDFLRRFQAGMHAAMESSVVEARKTVEASFAPLLETVRGISAAQQQELHGLYKKAGEEAAEQHRERLRAISNQWMLATVASLDQQARGVVAGIAKNAEQQLRTACEQVFSGLGDALRERMREITVGMDTEKTKGKSA
jgi:hypothetical protein